MLQSKLHEFKAVECWEGPNPDLKIRGMGKYGLQVGRVLPHLREVVVVVQWSVQSWVVLQVYRCTGVEVCQPESQLMRDRCTSQTWPTELQSVLPQAVPVKPCEATSGRAVCYYELLHRKPARVMSPRQV